MLHLDSDSQLLPKRHDSDSQLLPKRQILDSSKLKELADDNFKFVENGRQFSKQVENTVEKM